MNCRYGEGVSRHGADRWIGPGGRCLFLVGWLLSGGGSSLFADDRVTLIPEGAVDPVVIVGTVENYTGESLIIRRNGVPNDRYPASSVVSVETLRMPKHDQGLELFQAGEIAMAEATLQAGLREEPREWVQREVLAELVRCAIRQGNLDAAGTYFQRITKDDPTTRHWKVAPLTWAPQAMAEGQRALARSWFDSPASSERLMAASWLLLDTVYGHTAETKLKDLSRDTNRVVSALARCQLWRLQMGTPLDEVELARWRRDVRKLPQELRAGPHYLVGKALMQRREPTLAAAEFLWLPMVYREPEDLAARALLDASRALESVGQTVDAIALLDRLDRNYRWSASAAEGRQARSVLSSEGNSDKNP
ncbi:MAG: hypothetical protein DWH91_01225 [Planctomycetota bacterium]|nr:MAG: hypothetical protein DWH91_01225 [Planctomycetota bacterium]